MRSLLTSTRVPTTVGKLFILAAICLWNPHSSMSQEDLEVEDNRLQNVENEPENWLNYGRDYGQQRFSPLSQIHSHNVARLSPAWIYQTGVSATFQTSPIVSDGVLYATVPGGHVLAIDASSGLLLWRYQHKLSERKLCCGITNRGMALGYGKVYVATPDAHLVALEAATGKMLWVVSITSESYEIIQSLNGREDEDAPSDEPRSAGLGLGTNMAPLVYEGRVYVGVTGAGYARQVNRRTSSVAAETTVREREGNRGYLAAFDAEDGSEIWRWHSVPEQGWEGNFVDRTIDGVDLNRNVENELAQVENNLDSWQSGGGSVWHTPSVDPQTGLLYFGTGNPAPQMDDRLRPGDNLYTSSLVAIEARTGDLHWYHQQVPHDRWGYDVASPPILFDWLSPGGIPRRAVGQASKTGWFYILDRITGELLLRSQAFVAQRNLFAAPSKEGVLIYPGAAGGSSWSPVSFDPRTGLVYVAALHLPFSYQIHESEESNSSDYITAKPVNNESHGTLTAIDTTTGEHAWQLITENPLVGGTLATAGDLLFFGEGSGLFSALNAASGERLWSFQCGAGVNAPPISYKVGDRQFVAVAAGGHELFGFPLGSALIAFALPRQHDISATMPPKSETKPIEDQIKELQD